MRTMALSIFSLTQASATSKVVRRWRLQAARGSHANASSIRPHSTIKSKSLARTWARSRIRVASPKTQHHPGGESRVIPLFSELVAYLREAFEQAEPGTEYVITRYRDATQNFRTQLERIIRRAGVEPWPKLFQNLRSSRETELARTWPLHVVTKWIGNSQPVALKHYLQVTDDDYDRASSVSDRVDGAVQNPVQQAHARTCLQLHDIKTSLENQAGFTDLHEHAATCAAPNRNRMGEAGLEPARPLWTGDFKSPASAIPPLALRS